MQSEASDLEEQEESHKRGHDSLDDCTTVAWRLTFAYRLRLNYFNMVALLLVHVLAHRELPVLHALPKVTLKYGLS